MTVEKARERIERRIKQQIDDYKGPPVPQLVTVGVADLRTILEALSTPAMSEDCPDCYKGVTFGLSGYCPTCGSTGKRLDASRAVDEPTEAMVEAGARILHRHVVPEEPWEDCPGLHDEHRRAAADAYRAMRAAQGERL